MIVVVGNTRSGSSLMMQVLAEAGVKCDGGGAQYPFFEDPRSLQHPMQGDWRWLADHEGGAVKLLDPHRYWPPPEGDYRFVFMRRDAREQALSGFKLGKKVAGRDFSKHVDDMRKAYREDQKRTRRMLPKRGPVREVWFEDIITPGWCELPFLADFLKIPRDVLRQAHERALIPRSPACLPYLLEEKLLCRGRA